MAGDFQEIGHSGGTITFTFGVNEQERDAYSTTYQSIRPVPVALIGIWALCPSGVPVGTYNLGFGTGTGAPPLPNCVPVMLASDSKGKFGHHCPACDGYWRSGPWANLCPYCAVEALPYEFLSNAQRRYVEHYCKVLTDAMAADDVTAAVIDMDAVADAVGASGEKPAFYVSEQSQQHKFVCHACEEFNDILGRFGFCSLCGTRNDLVEYEERIVPALRERLNAANAPEDCVRDGVASFDSFVAQYAKQLAAAVSMIARRRKRLTTQRFHDLLEVQDVLVKWFGIELCAGMPPEEVQTVARLFHRRHVYEHNGGEVDERYLKESGDTTVRLKQHIHETQEDAHALIGSLLKMARNVHRGFHEIVEPVDEPIKALKDKKARMAAYR